MDDKSFTIRVPKRWARIAMIVGVTALIAAPLTAVASHVFNDVPDSHTFHNNITWLADADVTRGCNPPDNTEFCPDDNVTRGQMAAFMQRFAQYIDAEDGTPAQADNADTLDGLNSSDLTTAAFLASDDGPVTVAASSTVNVMTLDLPAGSYLIQGRVSVNQNQGVAGRNLTCTLAAGATSQTNNNFWTEPNGGIDTLDVSFMIVHEFGSAGQAVLSCSAGSGWDGNVLDPTITAISVNEVQASVATSAVSEDANG